MYESSCEHNCLFNESYTQPCFVITVVERRNVRITVIERRNVRITVVERRNVRITVVELRNVRITVVELRNVETVQHLHNAANNICFHYL